MLAVSAPVWASPSTVAPSMPARLSVRGFSLTLSVYVDLLRPSALVAVMVAWSWSLWMVTPMPVDLSKSAVTVQWSMLSTCAVYSCFDGSKPSMALPSTMMDVMAASCVARVR